MSKAKSRLSQSATRPPEKEAWLITPDSLRVSHASPRLLTRYLKQLPTLFISIPFWGVVVYLLTKVHPHQIADALLPSTYLPMIGAFFLASFFTFAFIFLHSRRSLLLSLLLCLYLFLRLQNVIFNWPVVIIPLMVILLLELMASFASRLRFT